MGKTLFFDKSLLSKTQTEYAIIKTSLGKSLIAFSDGAISWLSFGKDTFMQFTEMMMFFAKCKMFVNNNRVAKNVPDLFNKSSKIKCDIALFGSELELMVWKEISKINKGKTITYTDIANAIGKPDSVRAVASAVGKNPVSMLIPCHRVVHKNKGKSGYRWGTDVKEALVNFGF
jgi:AraC family transcriptional regulator, regulatory protein of adaptative response / methylated-DNA-[protein]-cysteine methyltransferase